MNDRRRRPTAGPAPLAACLYAAAALFFSGCAGVGTLVVLLPEENGAPGAVAVGEGSRQKILDIPYGAATVDSRGAIASETLTAETVRLTFAEALAAQPPRPVAFTLYFDTGSVEVAGDSRADLEALFAEVAKRRAVEVQVTGHTDRVGRVADNDRLSLERAEAVRAMLIRQGLKADFIRAVGRGEREPVIATEDEQPEPRNRRVEVIVR